MRWLKRLTKGSVFVLAALSALAFIYHNDQKVALDFWLFSTEPGSVGAWTLIGFSLGILCTWLLMLPGRLVGSVLIRRQGRKINRQNAALSNLRGQGEGANGK
jgi:uncharacterized membrane protein YciS (DUF1049 family)